MRWSSRLDFDLACQFHEHEGISASPFYTLNGRDRTFPGWKVPERNTMSKVSFKGKQKQKGKHRQPKICMSKHPWLIFHSFRKDICSKVHLRAQPDLNLHFAFWGLFGDRLVFSPGMLWDSTRNGFGNNISKKNSKPHGVYIQGCLQTGKGWKARCFWML